MISVKEAKSILSENIETGPVKRVPLEDAIGFTLAEDIHSPIDVPSFDNSAMDGYALTLDGNTSELKVSHIIQAGAAELPVIKTDEAARIFTGAPVPEGTDTVIQQELIERNGDLIHFDPSAIQKGANIRLKGSQNRKGDLLIEAGSLITPGTIGLLASVGIGEVKIYRSPSVAIILTGNELREVGTTLELGQIYNSNGPVLKTYLRQLGVTEIEVFKAPDKPEELQKSIDAALEKHDFILLSGGISVGDYDFVKEGLAKGGVRELFYKIKQRPGKPLFAGKKGQKLIFALPGNPASVISCFVQYVKPSLLQWMGSKTSWQPTAVLPISNNYSKKQGFTFFMKALMENGKVSTLTGQESFNQISFAVANCFVELPEDNEEVEAGTMVNVYSW
jgi:molybdopterin molybdotransferase